MSNEVISDVTQEAVVESAQELTESDRMANALNYLGQEELEKANDVQTVPEEQAAQEQAREVEKPDDNRSDYYAKLVEKDREIRNLKSQLKSTAPDYKSLAKEDPQRVLQELGIGMDQVIDMWAGKDSAEPEEAQVQENSEILQLRQELEQIKQERQQNHYNQAVNNELNKIYSAVNASGEDRWELVKTTNNYELVLDTAAEIYKLNPDSVPNYEDVLNAVENHLETHYGGLYEQLSKISKLQSKFSAKVGTPEKIQQEMKKAPIPGPTLSTSHSSDTPTPRGFSEAERFERALQVLENSGD